jgi:hypothetical protein
MYTSNWINVLLTPWDKDYELHLISPRQELTRGRVPGRQTAVCKEQRGEGLQSGRPNLEQGQEEPGEEELVKTPHGSRVGRAWS